MTGRAISHYQILEKLGEGGMGVVYRARDTRLDRIVALKFLPPEFAVDPDRKRRFIREARAASALNHPHIVTIHDIAAAEGADFIVMEYVSGRTLGDMISAKPLTVSEALRYAAQILDALITAHSAGIVHRDLKPGNVMVTDEGRVKILDFGLAKLVESSPPGANSTLTLVAGTAAYMAPEQAEGRPADARSDIYSFGAVLYEMLSGRRAFTGLLRQAPLPLANSPPELQQIVTRCLRSNPEQRFQSGAELKSALESIDPDRATAPSIAVLPFANLSGDKENEYFSDGLAEEIINALTKLPGLRVPARTSSFAFRGKEMDVAEIGAKLRVGHILEGSVRKAGDRIRVTAQLINVADGYHLWSERYDRQMADIFDIQDEIALAIVGNLRVRLAGEQPLIRRHTANLEAYNLYLRGRHWWNQCTRDSWRNAIVCFERGVAEDPAYAPPYAGLAVAYTYLAIHGWARPTQVMPAARRNAAKALEVDDSLAEAHWALAYVHQWYEWDWSRAESEYRRAVALSPGDAHIRIAHAGFLMFLGQTEESLREAHRALELDPVSEEVNRLMIYLLCIARRFDEAEQHGRQAVQLHPRGAGIHLHLGLAYSLSGRHDEALQSILLARSLAGDDPFYEWAHAYLLARRGEGDEAAAIARDIERRVDSFSPAWLAALYAAIGEKDRAFSLLDAALDGRDSVLVVARLDPLFSSLRSDPRFSEVLKRMGWED